LINHKKLSHPGKWPPGKRLSGKVTIRESSFRETSYPGKMTIRETTFREKNHPGKVTIRETTVNRCRVVYQADQLSPVVILVNF